MIVKVKLIKCPCLTLNIQFCKHYFESLLFVHSPWPCSFFSSSSLFFFHAFIFTQWLFLLSLEQSGGVPLRSSGLFKCHCKLCIFPLLWFKVCQLSGSPTSLLGGPKLFCALPGGKQCVDVHVRHGQIMRSFHDEVIRVN